MGKKLIYSLDDGKIEMTMQEMMDYTGLKRAALQHRLKQSNDSTLVLAKKGKHGIGGYNKPKKQPKLKLSDVYKNPEKIEKKKKANQILKNHPFYDQGEKGKLHRLLFGKWFRGEQWA